MPVEMGRFLVSTYNYSNMKKLIFLIIWMHSCCIVFAQKTPSILLEIEVPDTIYSNCINGVAKFTNTGSVTIMVDKFLSDCDNQLVFFQRNWFFVILKDSVEVEYHYITGLFQFDKMPIIKLKPSNTIFIPFNIPFNPEINSERVLNGTFSIQLSYKIRESSYLKNSWRRRKKGIESNIYSYSSNTENFVFLISE